MSKLCPILSNPASHNCRECACAWWNSSRRGCSIAVGTTDTDEEAYKTWITDALDVIMASVYLTGFALDVVNRGRELLK